WLEPLSVAKPDTHQSTSGPVVPEILTRLALFALWRADAGLEAGRCAILQRKLSKNGRKAKT
ncbi:MAG: hypothetical protein ACR2O1_08840, partial [Boseongicola sp.]